MIRATCYGSVIQHEDERGDGFPVGIWAIMSSSWLPDCGGHEPCRRQGDTGGKVAGHLDAVRSCV